MRRRTTHYGSRARKPAVRAGRRASSGLASLLRPLAQWSQRGGKGRPPRQDPALTTSRRLYRRTKAKPALSAILIALVCLLVSGAFLALLARQALPLALVFAAIIGWVVWKSLKSEGR